MDKGIMPAETIIALIFAFLIGAVLGSFLNVVIYRVPRGISIVSPPSSCGSCKQPIRWYHNIPIVSYIALRGRCGLCGAPFDLRYPVVELITALLAVACVAVFGLGFFAVRAFGFVSILIALTYIDLEHWLLPHAITWPGIALGLATSFIPGGPGVLDAFIGALAGFLGFWLLRVLASAILKKEALGGGDLYLLAMIGAFLGWQALLPVVFLASVQGSIIGIALILSHRKGGDEKGEGAAREPVDKKKSAEPSTQGSTGSSADEESEHDCTPPPNAVPFGPFLSLAALEMLFIGDLVFDLLEVAIGAK